VSLHFGYYPASLLFSAKRLRPGVPCEVSRETVTGYEMRVGPSAPAFGGGRQTTSCCWSQELWW